MFPLRLLIFIALLASVLAAQAPKETVLLWLDGAPGAQGTAEEDKPSLSLYPASGSTKTSTGVIVCPGGGYGHLAMDHEGVQIAVWLNNLGISAYILNTGSVPNIITPWNFGTRNALRAMCARAPPNSAIRPDHIGIWGFSAGGHLASTTATHFLIPTAKPTRLIGKATALTLRSYRILSSACLSLTPT